MEQKFIVLCHLLDGGEYLYKSSFDSVESAISTLFDVSKLVSYDDVVSYEIINVCRFDRNVRLGREFFDRDEK